MSRDVDSRPDQTPWQDNPILRSLLDHGGMTAVYHYGGLTAVSAKTRTVSLSSNRELVHPAFHNKNLFTVLNGGEISLAGRHAKVRRDGYHAMQS